MYLQRGEKKNLQFSKILLKVILRDKGKKIFLNGGKELFWPTTYLRDSFQKPCEDENQNRPKKKKKLDERLLPKYPPIKLLETVHLFLYADLESI